MSSKLDHVMLKYPECQSSESREAITFMNFMKVRLSFQYPYQISDGAKLNEPWIWFIVTGFSYHCKTVSFIKAFWWGPVWVSHTFTVCSLPLPCPLCTTPFSYQKDISGDGTASLVIHVLLAKVITSLRWHSESTPSLWRFLSRSQWV